MEPAWPLRWERSAASAHGGIRLSLIRLRSESSPIPHQSTMLGHVESQWSGRPLGKAGAGDGTKVILGL